MTKGKFPLIFPWQFTEFDKRFVTLTDIEDTLAFRTISDSLLCADVKDTLSFSVTRDRIIFGNIEDAIRFTEVRI